MRVLADENLPKAIVNTLLAAGHDVLWARTDCAGWKDVLLLERAETESRILLTLDKDFWQIAIQRRIPLRESGVILLRVHPAKEENLEPLIWAIVEANQSWAGHVSIVDREGIQMLPTRK